MSTDGSTSQANFIIQVSDISDEIPILISSTELLRRLQILPFNFTLEVEDKDEGDTHTFSSMDLPVWLSLDSDTGILSGTAPSTQGFASFDITVTDSGGLFSTKSYSLEVGEGVEVGIIPSFGHHKQQFIDYIQSIKLKDKQDDSEYMIADKMVDTLMGQNIKTQKMYELQVTHEQQTEGAIDINDLLEVAKMVSGRKSPVDDIQKMAADWDDNDIIDINDLLGVAKRVAGRIQDDDWAFYDNTGGNKLEYDDVSQVHKMDILIENNVEIGFIGDIKGDVNASYVPDQHDKAPVTPAPKPAPQLLDTLTVDTNTPSIEDSLTPDVV